MPQLVDNSKIVAATRGFNASFNRALEQRPAQYRDISTTVQSTGSSETYNWLGAAPTLARWLADRELHPLRADGQEIPNLDFATGIELAANDIDDDRLGVLGARAEMLADRTLVHFEQGVMNLLNNGFSALGYDGQAFFSATHSDGGSAAQSNTAAAAALSQTTFDAAVAQMMSVTDEKGVPFNVRPTHLIVPPGLRSVARGIVQAEFLANGGSNVNFGAVSLLVSPFLTDTNGWFLVDASRALRPFIVQERRAISLVEQSDPQSEGMFNRRAVRLGVDWRGNFAYSFWQLAYGNQGA